MGAQTTFLYPFLAAAATGFVSLVLLRVKPAILSQSLSDFTGVTAGKALFFTFILAGLFLGVFAVDHAAIEQLRWGILLYILLLSTWIDIERRIIPNGLIIFGLTSSVGFFFLSGGQPIDIYLGGAVLIAFLIINIMSIKVFKKKGLGGGDLKLCIIMVLLCGVDGLWAIGVSIMLGGSFGAVAILTSTLDRKDYLPFAPFLLAGTITGYFGVSWQEASLYLYGF